MQIYLTNETKFEGVINLILNEIKFASFKLNLSEFNALIITSKNALKALEINKIKLDLNINTYAVGQKTADYALSLGFKNVKFASKAYGDELFTQFKDELKSQKCLYLRAEKIASNLSELLLQNNINLTQIIAYKNTFKHCDIELQSPCIVIFSAPSSVEFFFKNYKLDKNDKSIAIGKSTAKALQKYYINPILPHSQTLEECVILARKLNQK